MTDLSQKVALITGSARGIGKAVALRYARLGASVVIKGAYFTMQQAARQIADPGRIIYIGSSTTGYPRPGYALHGGSKIAPDYLVRVLAQELGKRGVTVNAVIPTATQGAGVNATIEDRHRMQQFIDDFMPMGRLATVEDVADACEYFAGPLSAFVSGQQLLLSGGGLT